MENQKQPNDFIISIAGPNIDTSIVTIEEIQLYSRERKRIALICSDKKTYGEIDRMNYQLVSNYSKPKVMAVQSKNKSYLEVYEFLLQRFRRGLIVVEIDTISDPTADLIAKSDFLTDNDIDVMICRDGFETITNHELQRANLLRIHANPDLDPMVFTNLGEFYKEKMLGIMVAQFIVNEQYAEVNAYFEKQNSEYSKQGLSNIVDYYQLNKQLAFFIYFDVASGRLLGVDGATVKAFLQRNRVMFPIPPDQLDAVVADLTIE